MAGKCCHHLKGLHGDMIFFYYQWLKIISVSSSHYIFEEKKQVASASNSATKQPTSLQLHREASKLTHIHLAGNNYPFTHFKSMYLYGIVSSGTARAEHAHLFDGAMEYVFQLNPCLS